MDCVDYLQALHELREKIRRYDMLKAQYEGALDTLNRARKRQPRATADFDIAKKEAYIHKKIGPEPEKPKGIMKLAIPVYRKKMKAYEEAYADYRARYAEGERSYYVPIIMSMRTNDPSSKKKRKRKSRVISTKLKSIMKV